MDNRYEDLFIDNVIDEVIKDFLFEADKILSNLQNMDTKTAIRKLKGIMAASYFIRKLARNKREYDAEVNRAYGEAKYHYRTLLSQLTSKYSSDIFNPGKDSPDSKAEILKESVLELEVPDGFFVNGKLLGQVALKNGFWRAKVDGEEIYGKPLGGNKLEAYFKIKDGKIYWFYEPKPVYIQSGWILDPPKGDPETAMIAAMISIVIILMLVGE